MIYLITVLIPTYNNFNSFLKTVNSYYSDKRVKIIVSDDSTNNIVKNKIKNFCINKNIKYINGPQKLPVQNWNSLMKMIDTEFFVINHHDDYPCNLKFLDSLVTNRTGLMILPVTSFARGKSAHKIYSWQQLLFSKICLMALNPSFNMFLSPTASLIINSKAKDIFFDENLKWFVDCEWYSRILSKIIQNKLNVVFFNKSRVISIQAKNSITYSMKNKLKEQIKLDKDYLNAKGYIPNKAIVSIQYIFLIFVLSITKFKQYFLN
tara:strand:+ start:49 stop:840 length:792 start_codon:yes stop_codon:yes gene_type:complete